MTESEWVPFDAPAALAAHWAKLLSAPFWSSILCILPEVLMTNIISGFAGSAPQAEPDVIAMIIQSKNVRIILSTPSG